MAENDAEDDRIGKPLRQANSKLVWANDPNTGQRIQVIVESRPGVVQLIEEHLNRNGGDCHMAHHLSFRLRLFGDGVGGDHSIKVC